MAHGSWEMEVGRWEMADGGSTERGVRMDVGRGMERGRGVRRVLYKNWKGIQLICKYANNIRTQLQLNTKHE